MTEPMTPVENAKWAIEQLVGPQVDANSVIRAMAQAFWTPDAVMLAARSGLDLPLTDAQATALWQVMLDAGLEEN